VKQSMTCDPLMVANLPILLQAQHE
jgi:hypothetical protein